MSHLPDILLRKFSVVLMTIVAPETSTLCVQDEGQSTEIWLYIIKQCVNGSRTTSLCHPAEATDVSRT